VGGSALHEVKSVGATCNIAIVSANAFDKGLDTMWGSGPKTSS
jgi:hypothetical protein